MISLERSPVQEIRASPLEQASIRLFIKREDLYGAAAHGNKFRKLKHHLRKARTLQKSELVSMGGAFSNHLLATAAAGAALNIPTIGLIRGEIDADNPTIQLLQGWRMKLIQLSRAAFKFENLSNIESQVLKDYPHAYFIPLGGGGRLGCLGVSEIVEEVEMQTDHTFDWWICPAGTGTTVWGIAMTLPAHAKLLVMSALRKTNKVTKWPTVQGLLKERCFIEQAALNGFGRQNLEIEQWILDFYDQQKILLDPIYTGKMMFHFFKLVQEGFFDVGSKILMLHTGGLQGNFGYNYRFGAQLPTPPSEFFKSDITTSLM